tara:strand:- start:31 stop:933 length:903 start_codon:yes stop_codon:yes gene_type:complete
MHKIFELRFIEIVRWYFFKYFTKKETMTSYVLGHKMVLDLRTDGISEALAKYGHREVDMLSILRNAVTPDMHVLDLGGNIGYYSMEFGRLLGETGKLLVVEPDPRNIKTLKMNLSNISGVPVILQSLAISDKPGSASLISAVKSNLSTLVVHDTNVVDDYINVDTKTIEQVAKDYLDDKVDFIRMDIEGAEYEALIGLLPFLKRSGSKPKILFEVHPKAYDEKRPMKNLLESLSVDYGYKIKEIVSTQGGKDFFSKKGVEPYKKMRSDGRYRFFYSIDDNDLAIESIITDPKVVRYVLMT